MVLTVANHQPVLSTSYTWENQFQDGYWTYALEDVWKGLQDCFASLQAECQSRFGVSLQELRAIGISAMMHGYLVFDDNEQLLTPFRTWRNTTTDDASRRLTEVFDFPIPQRWSIAHLYQAMLSEEPHVGSVAHMTTLAGYVHWQLTGQQVLGVGEASGMFPIDKASCDFDADRIARFESLSAPLKETLEIRWQLRNLLPSVQPAGQLAGKLNEAGARKLDPAGHLQPGANFCPPEGDAGTGMVATNSIRVRTGNVSAGTSVFAMLVLEKELSRAYSEIDLVTTPDGSLVAMVHANNCTSDCNAWFSLFGEVAQVLGAQVTTNELFEKLLPLALEGDADAGGLLNYGFLSGEHIFGLPEGRPLFVREPNSGFGLANFVRAQLFGSLCALRAGLEILIESEQVQLDGLRGHGGFFKTPGVGQRIMAAATGTPVSVLEGAGEGGAWGIALLAAYTVRSEATQSLPEFLEVVFADKEGPSVDPAPADCEGFDAYFARHQKGLAIERAAIKHF